MIVLDASAVVELLLRGRASSTIFWRAAHRRQRLHAPHLIDGEVLHALRRHYLSGELTLERGAQAVTQYRGLRIQRYPHLVLLNRVWELRDVLTAYDAFYVALAELLRAPLITFDQSLARSKGHGARIELIG